MPLCACFGARAQQKTSPPVHEVDDALAHPPPPPRGASHGALRAAQERGKGASGSPVPAIEPGPLSSERSGTGVASAGRVGDDEAEGDFYDEILPTSPPPPIAQAQVPAHVITRETQHKPPRQAGNVGVAAIPAPRLGELIPNRQAHEALESNGMLWLGDRQPHHDAFLKDVVLDSGIPASLRPSPSAQPGGGEVILSAPLEIPDLQVEGNGLSAVGPLSPSEIDSALRAAPIIVPTLALQSNASIHEASLPPITHGSETRISPLNGLQELHENPTDIPVLLRSTGTRDTPASRAAMPEWEAEARMYHEALGHTVSFADLVQRSRSGDKSLGGIPPLDIRSADLHCPTCLLRRAQAILEQNKKKHAFKDKGGAEGVAYWESKLRSQQATKLTASHEGGGAGFRPAGQKLDAQQAGIKDSFSATMLSPTHTEQGSELLGIDLSIWSGLATTCFIPEQRGQRKQIV